MSLVEHPKSTMLPALVEGQRLDRATFHKRYQAMPPGTRAELIGGVVHMPSPVSVDHAERDSDASDWLGHYRLATPGIRKATNATTQFGNYGEPQPDQILLIPEQLGGKSRIVDGFIVGAPELVVEVGKSSRPIDLGPKKLDYQRAGVAEYIFVGVEPSEIVWFILRDNQYIELAPGADGILRSEVFPGLWLDPSALLQQNMDRVIEVLDQGIASPEHAEFVASLTR